MRVNQKRTLKVESKKDKTAKTVPKLPIRLVESSQDDYWVPASDGILGLAPNGSFFKYLKATYDENDSISFAFKHIVYDKTKPSKNLVASVYAYMNPTPERHYVKKDIVGTYPIDKNSTFWYFQGGLELKDSELFYKDQTVCLDTLLPDMFGMVDSSVWCLRAKQAACNLEKDPKCLRENADETRIPSIMLTIEDKVFEITSDDYVYFTKEGMQCRLGISYMARSQGSCPADTQVTVGKLFFEKFTPILEYDRKVDEFKLTLTKKFRSTGDQRVIWIILGIAAAVLAVLALLWVCSKRKRRNATNLYVAHDNLA